MRFDVVTLAPKVPAGRDANLTLPYFSHPISMSKEQNLETQQRFGEAVNSGNLQELHDLMSPRVVDHDPAPDQLPGPAGFIRFFQELREAFPDLAITPECILADEDSVALAYTMTGTHRGFFLGAAPSGRRISARGVQIARFADGKIVERWGSSDQLGILEQVGEPVMP
jgi:steroid delta-isomerase-like uncharacterized protein